MELCLKTADSVRGSLKGSSNERESVRGPHSRQMAGDLAGSASLQRTRRARGGGSGWKPSRRIPAQQVEGETCAEL